MLKEENLYKKKRSLLSVLTKVNVGIGVSILLSSFLFLPRHLKDKNDITKYLGYESVSQEEILQAIDQNNNLTKEEKEYTKTFTKMMMEEYPNLDYRLYYENVKTLDMNSVTYEGICEQHELQNMAGCYTSTKNCIDYTSFEVLDHELGHTMNSYYHFGVPSLVRSAEKGHFLNEAFVNRLVNDQDSYQIQGAFLNFCLKRLNYSMQDYTEKGIWYFIDLLEEKYSDVNISLIIDYFDERTDQQFSNSEPFFIDDNQEVLDEIFKMALKNIQEDEDLYESFFDFYELLRYAKDRNIDAVYLDQYNAYLESQGYFNSYKRTK